MLKKMTFSNFSFSFRSRRRKQHSPDGHDENEHDDRYLHHSVATDADAVVMATVVVTAAWRRATPLATAMMMMVTMVMGRVGVSVATLSVCLVFRRRWLYAVWLVVRPEIPPIYLLRQSHMHYGHNCTNEIKLHLNEQIFTLTRKRLHPEQIVQKTEYCPAAWFSLSRIDYCNSVLYGAPSGTIQKF